MEGQILNCAMAPSQTRATAFEAPSGAGKGGEGEMNEMTVYTPAPGTMDVDEFMAFMETRPKGEDWDLIDGVAVMMAPASYAHQQIAFNFCVLLNAAFATQGLDLRAVINVGVRSPGVRRFQPEPDVAVIPGIAGYELY
jgi:Uma2 family endonuclease